MPIDDTEPTEEGRIRQIINEELALLTRGVVSEIHLFESESDISNHEATVVSLDGEDIIAKHAPIIAPLPNAAVPPDLEAENLPNAIVDFIGGNESSPIVTGWAYTTENSAPKASAGDINITRGDMRFTIKGGGTKIEIMNTDGSLGFQLDFETGEFAIADGSGSGIEATNDGNLHLYGSVKQHTSSTISF